MEREARATHGRSRLTLDELWWPRFLREVQRSWFDFLAYGEAGGVMSGVRGLPAIAATSDEVRWRSGAGGRWCNNGILDLIAFVNRKKRSGISLRLIRSDADVVSSVGFVLTMSTL